MTPVFKNLVEMQQHSCKVNGHRKMYGTKQEDGSFSWTTYGELGRAVDRFRGGLARLGVVKGDKVAVISANCVEWVAGCYATYGLGAHYVPMYESQNLEEWIYIIKDSGAKILLVKNPEIYDRVRHLPDEIQTLERVIPLYEARALPHCYTQLCELGDKYPVSAYIPDGEEPMGLIYTSGTTGDPKGVILSHRSMITEIQSLMEVAKSMPFVPEDRGLSFLPWGHLMGQLQEVHILMYVGFSSCLVRDLKEIIDDLVQVRPTIFFAVPRLYTKLHDGVMKNIEQKNKVIRTLFASGLKARVKMNQGSSVSVLDSMAAGLAKKLVFAKIRQLFGGHLRIAFSGGAALNEKVVEFLDGIGIPLFEGYGQTETTMAVTMNFPGSRRQGSVGKAIPQAVVKIDTSISDTKEGEGEIVVYGPLLMLGYHNLPEETAATIDPDGGCRTGDIGRLDEDGFLYLTGRIKEIYKMENGKYVSPGPLEEELKLSPYINQALISGTNMRYNVAVITPEEEELKDWAQGKGLNISSPEWKESAEIQALFEQEIKTHSTEFKKFEKPEKFKLVWDDWSDENALLTPTLKLKRRQVIQKYQPLIDTLYEN